MNGPQTLDENPGCLKCISGINLSSADKNLFTIAFILYFQNKVLAIGKSLKNRYFCSWQFNKFRFLTIKRYYFIASFISSYSFIALFIKTKSSLSKTNI